MLESDYSGALSILLKYPSPHPRHPRTFVNDALYLEKNPNIQGGSSMILKYSDRIPSFSGRSPTAQRPNPFVTPPIGMSPLNAPRINRRLDSLFQDVSGGVAKAVKGAVVEARRNFNAAGSHHGGGVAHLRKSLSSTDSGLSPSNPSAAAMAELNKRVFRLESRSKALGSMLAEALSQFRAAQKVQGDESEKKGEKKDGGADAVTTEEASPLPIDVLLAKVQFVQVYLDDPTIPIEGVENHNPDSPFTIAGSEWDKLSIRSPPSAANSPAKSPTPLPSKATNSPLTKVGAIETSPAAKPSTSSSGTSSPQSLGSSGMANLDGVADTVNTTKNRACQPPSHPKIETQHRTAASRSRPVSHTRAPLSESPFSWMLGECKDTQADFVPSSPQSRTTSLSKSREDGLFGSREDTRASEKGLQRDKRVSLERLGL